MNIKDTIQNKLDEHIEVKYIEISDTTGRHVNCLLYTSPSPRDRG